MVTLVLFFSGNLMNLFVYIVNNFFRIVMQGNEILLILDSMIHR